jgi:hypothetical protein
MLLLEIGLVLSVSFWVGDREVFEIAEDLARAEGARVEGGHWEGWC